MRKFLLLFAAFCAMAVPVFAPVPAFAAGEGRVSVKCTNSNDICVKDLPRTSANSQFVKRFISITIAIVAAVCVLFVAIGGMRYVLSQGDPQAAAKARSTIIYALVGLAVTISAQAIVTVAIKVVE